MSFNISLRSCSTSQECNPDCVANFNASDSIAWDKVTTEDVENFHRAILNGLPDISSDVLDCCNAECISHTSTIDFYCNQFLSSLSSSASLCLPQKSKRRKVVPGWNDHVQQHKNSAVFWNKLWNDAGCPSSGILFDLRQHTKRQYKYSIRKVKRQREHFIRRKTASALSRKNKTLFWREVKKIKRSSSTRNTQRPLVDSKLGRDKSDGTSLSSNHLILASLLLLHFSHISLHLFSVMATCLKHYVIAC